jgi:predicted TIM-barrel fold metal-dependent hydrolase
MTRSVRALAIGMFLMTSLLCGAAQPWAGPIFDAHLHYNDDAVARYPIAQVTELFRKSGVQAILANSRPNDGSRALFEAKPAGIAVVPFIRVYRDRGDYGTWYNNMDIHDMIVAEHKRGIYRGIGEFHVFGKDASTEVVGKIVNFAVANDLLLHAHCDEDALERLFAHNPKARIVWAHTGFTTPLTRVEQLLAKYPQLWGELSYRWDVAEGGGIAPQWKALFVRHPTRFLVGSDTWVNQRWDSYPETIASYRAWLGELPPAVAEQVAWKNGARLFGLK